MYFNKTHFFSSNHAMSFLRRNFFEKTKNSKEISLVKTQLFEKKISYFIIFKNPNDQYVLHNEIVPGNGHFSHETKTLIVNLIS